MKGSFDHPYPTTNIMWAPNKKGGVNVEKDLLATTGDYLRIWSIGDDDEVHLEGLLNNVRRGSGGVGACVCLCVFSVLTPILFPLIRTKAASTAPR